MLGHYSLQRLATYTPNAIYVNGWEEPPASSYIVAYAERMRVPESGNQMNGRMDPTFMGVIRRWRSEKMRKWVFIDFSVEERQTNIYER